MASGSLSCHTGAGGFGDGESLLGGDGVGDGALLSGGDGAGDGEALYDGNGVGDGVSTPCPRATLVPTPAMANIATPASKVIFACLIMDTPWPSGSLPHPSRHTPRHKAILALLTDMFQGLPQLCGTANRKQERSQVPSYCTTGRCRTLWHRFGSGGLYLLATPPNASALKVQYYPAREATTHSDGTLCCRISL
jgi:hypothetical protein